MSVKTTKMTLPLSVLLLLNAALKKTVFSRKFYQEINDKVLSKLATVDTNLYFICYFTLLLLAILNKKVEIKRFLVSQRSNLLQLIRRSIYAVLGSDLLKSNHKYLARTFSKQTSVQSKTSETNNGSSENNESSTEEEKTETKPVSNLAIHLKNISSYLSDIRIFNRLVESIKYMPWIIDEFHSLVDPLAATPKLDRFINLLQALNCLVLELLENAGWLTDHNWVGTSDNNYWCIETYIWCLRVWGVYLLIEIIELLRRNPVSKWNKSWSILMFQQLVQVPLVLHWSLYDGCLTPFWVGLCGSGALWFQFKDMWSSLEL